MARRFCTHCHAACGPADRFCAACGQPLAAAAASPSGDWGEVKAATILFADIVDSTRQIAELSPEQAMQRLQPAVERIVRIVEQHHGTVLRTLGDGIMALFGVPLALEQHAEQACLAAARMQQAFDPVQGGAGLALRVGLHTGKVASDPTEAGDRRGGGAHGVAIHLASRVAAQADPGQVLLTEETRHLLRPGLLAARPIGSFPLKGIAHPVALFALRLDVGSASMPDPAARAGRFVGRGDEMAQLVHALGRTRAGQGQIVCVSGEAGSGKTRLCAEFARRCQDIGARVVWVQVHPLSHALPLRPAREVVASLCLGASPDLAADDLRRRIDAALQRAGHPDAADAALVHDLMGVADDAQRHGHRLAGQDSRQLQLLALLADLVRADAETLRLLVVDDLHWLDLASWPILNVLADALVATQTLLVVNHRRSLPPPWLHLPHAAVLPLVALAPLAMCAIVAERLAVPQRPDAVAAMPEGDQEVWIDRIAARSQGNPFFAQELVRHLRRTGVDPARWAAELPDSIEALVTTRIDALPAADKRILQTCAVIGKHVDVAVLARVARLPLGRLAPALRRLQAAELIAPAQGLHGARALTFMHPVIQEAAYGAQLRVRVKGVHARVAAVMEERFAHGPHAGELAALTAHHWEQAGRFLPAARQAVRAAQWLRTGDAGASIAAWRKVLMLLEREAHGDEARALSALAAGRIVFLGWRVGISAQEVTQLVDRALAQASGADPRLPQLLRFAHARMMQSGGGSADDYVHAVQDVLAMPTPPGDAGRRAMLHVVLCQAYSWAGLLREALAASDIALAGIAQVSAFDSDFIGFNVEQWAVGLRMRVLCRMGRLSQAQACRDRLAVLSRHEPDVVMKGIDRSLALELDCLQGRARHAWGRLRQQGRAAGPQNDYLRVTDAYFLSFLEMACHRYAVACSQIQEGLAYLRDRRVAIDFEVELRALWSEALAARGAWSSAAQSAQQVIGLSRQRGNRVVECRAALVCARAQAHGVAIGQPGATRHSDWIAYAGELLDVTGADLWRPMWNAVRARARAKGTAGV
ncbi:AAA family ATPase [Ottowia sp.]|uniref:AAA family ATPase n=1 Tax=Ottowia sp. TaxID=1898956 RepID=UPI00394FC989